MATIDFIVSGNRIATESFTIGKIYEIIFTDGSFLICACNHVGNNFVVFQRELPELLFTLNMETASSVRSIKETGGGGGTYNYNDLENKPQINSVGLSGNKSSSDLGLQSALDASQLDAVNSGITSAKVTAFEGKQDAITSNNKLSADLVDDTTTTNKFVTVADKTAWNAKQNALTFDNVPTRNSNNPVKSGGIYTALSGKQDTIDNLATIESGAAAGATAVQPTILDSALALKQDALTTAQLAAVNSGITSADVEQITTNKNNILSNTLNGGGINKATINNGTGSETLLIPCDPITGRVVVKLAEFTSTDTDVSTSYAQFIYTDDTLSGGLEIGRGTNLRASAILSKTVKSIKLFAADTTAHSAGDTFTFTNLELCSLDDDSLPYQPYAWDNARITAWILSHS